MTLQDFADMTMIVIREEGIGSDLPTFVLPDTRDIRVIQEIPDDVDHRDAVQNVVRQSGYQTREFFFGVKFGSRQITVGQYRPGQPTEFMTITEVADEYSVATIPPCDWWKT